MQAKDFMTEPVMCCTADTNLTDVAKLMAEYDCGAIPVAASGEGGRLAGVITDRDIVIRVVARGRNPSEIPASEIMSSPVFTVTPETSEQELCRLMEQRQVRRVPVVDENGACCGVVSQADIARKAPESETAEVVRDISQPAAARGA